MSELAALNALVTQAGYVIPSSFPGVTDQASYLYYVFLKTSPHLSHMATEVGAALNGLLCGLVLAMIFTYFRSSTGDSLSLRLTILFLACLTLTSFILTQYQTNLIHSHPGNEFKEIVHRNVILEFTALGFHGVAGFISQTFWSRKAAALWEYKVWVVVPVVFLIFSHVVLGCVTVLYGVLSCPIIRFNWGPDTPITELVSRIPEVTRWGVVAGNIGLGWAVEALLADSLIFIFLMTALFTKKNQPGNIYFSGILQTLLVIITESMILILLAGVFYVVLCAQYSGVDGWFKTLYAVGSPLYMFGVLLSLLARGELRDRSSRRLTHETPKPLPSTPTSSNIQLSQLSPKEKFHHRGRSGDAEVGEGRVGYQVFSSDRGGRGADGAVDITVEFGGEKEGV